jgi:transposase
MLFSNFFAGKQVSLILDQRRNMPRGSQLSDIEKHSILEMHKNHLSHREIAKKIKRSKTAVTNFLKDPLKYGTKKRPGRRRKIDERSKRHILRAASNRNVSCARLVAEMNLKASRWTVNRVISRSKVLKKKKKKRSPPLKKSHKDARLKWAKDHMTWNTEWQQVVWSDEKKFNLDGPDGFSYYWHDLRKEELIFSTRAQGGGSVMIWASFGWLGKSSICFIDGRMNSYGYREVLKNHLIDIGDKMGGTSWIFQQDNAPVHRSKVNVAWFKTQKINLLPWPSLSPDLNPIENLWGLLVRKVYAEGKQFQTKEQLKAAIVRSWEDITLDDLHKLVNSMPDRIFEAIKLHGAKTKY